MNTFIFVQIKTETDREIVSYTVVQIKTSHLSKSPSLEVYIKSHRD